MGLPHSKETDKFFEAILSLKNIKECYNFFEDVCTIKETESMAQRFEVAYLLSKGTIYSEIAKKTGASTATISRVSKCLSYGCDGYKLAIKRLKEKND